MKKSLLYFTGIVMLMLVLSVQVSAQEEDPWSFENITNTGLYGNGTDSVIPLSDPSSNQETQSTNSNTGNNATGPTNSNTGNNANLQSTNSNTNNNNSKDNPKYLLTNPLGKTTNIQDVIVNVVKVVQILLMMAAVVYIIWAGFLFVSARGDTAKITKARNALLWGFIGVALVLGAQVIVTTIKNSVNSVFYDTTK